jgi:two-component system, NarL family, sensor kinase
MPPVIAGPAWRRALASAVAVLTTVAWLGGLALAGLNGNAVSAVAGIGAVGFAVAGALVVFQRPDNRLGWVFCAGALSMSVLGVGGAYANRALVHAPGSLPGGLFAAWLSDLAAIPTVGLFAGVLPQLFPTGRPISRWWRLPLWAAWAYIVLGAVGNAFVPHQLESVPAEASPYAIAAAKGLFTGFIVLSVPLGAVALIGALASLVVRWRRATGDERQQLKWFIAGVCLLPAPLILHQVAPVASDAALSVLFAVIPATLGVAILRYRLYDLDLVVRRAVAYTAVSVVVAGLYLGLVAMAQLAVGGTVSLGVHLAAAVAAAAVFQPIRARIQGAVDRRFYGDRARPYEAVARLGRRLEGALVPEIVLPGVVETVAGALRLPYAAIDLRDGDQWLPAAEHGRRAGDPVSFPMTYQAKVVGRMLVCPRARQDGLSAADQRLLADLARQAGVAAQAVRTTTALQRSRAELIAAREEERRRLRRDLHDGLGPTLAGVTMGLHAAATLVPTDPREAERLLAALERQIEEAIADIRRLVYGLRPPALDEFGLVRAVQLHAARIEGTPEGLVVTVDSPPQGLGKLPAAVEVAAYRIVTEALTNVARHAGARTAAVRLSLNGALELEVTDDGCGLPPDHAAGVGITGMRERAAELGGVLTVESRSGGTQVYARLPTPEI